MYLLGPLKSTDALIIFSPVFFLSLNFIFILFHNQFQLTVFFLIIALVSYFLPYLVISDWMADIINLNFVECWIFLYFLTVLLSFVLGHS